MVNPSVSCQALPVGDKVYNAYVLENLKALKYGDYLNVRQQKEITVPSTGIEALWMDQ